VVGLPEQLKKTGNFSYSIAFISTPAPSEPQMLNLGSTSHTRLLLLLSPILTTHYTSPTHFTCPPLKSRDQTLDMAMKSGFTTHACACTTRGTSGKCGCDCHDEFRILPVAIRAPSFFDVVLNPVAGQAGSPDWAFEYRPGMLGRMALKIGDAEPEVLSAPGVPPRPGRLTGGIPSSHFAIWLILLRVPGGKMDLDTIYKTLLEWLPAMKPKNQTIRASLTPSRQATILDGPVFINVRGESWRLRRAILR
jgi:hypothetical protein